MQRKIKDVSGTNYNVFELGDDFSILTLRY